MLLVTLTDICDDLDQGLEEEFKMQRSSLKAAAAVATGALLLSASLVAASPGSGISSVSTRGDGTASGRIKVNGEIKLEAKAGLRVFDQELTILPGGHTGWHSHPGPVLVTVKSGTFRYQDEDCSFTDYAAGQTVIDEGGSHVHIGRNPSDPNGPNPTNTDLSITYLLPAGTAPRIDVPAVSCP